MCATAPSRPASPPACPRTTWRQSRASPPGWRGAEVEIRILGPVEVEGAALGGSRPRGVLAVLALHANEVVSAERLVAALWGEEAPPSALKALQVTISRLRRALGDAAVIETTGAGYRLEIGRASRREI